MLCRVLQASRLLHKQSAPMFIYLRDHNKLINPELSKLNLSYSHPKNLVPDAPVHTPINFKLDPEMEVLLERQIFEEYKNKVLQGVIDEVEEVQPDPLWGEEPMPVHYFSRLSKTNLMAVSHPQRLDIEDSLNQIYSPYFATTFQGEITKETILAASIEQIPDICLKARHEGLVDGTLWFTIEERVQRGHKLHLLSPQQLIKLKYAFDGHTKQGTPLFHQILSSLLREDVQKMAIDDLIHLFYACRHSNPGLTNLQPEILQALKPLYSQFTFDQKVNFLLAFTLYTKPIKFHKQVHRKRKNEFKELANSIVFRLNFWELELNDDRVSKLIFSLAKLRLKNTKFISLPLLQHIQANFEAYTASKQRLFQAVVYLPEVENGQGVGDQEFMKRLKDVALPRWAQFDKIEQIRLVHSFWNYGLMDEALLEYYKGIEFEADSTLLYYASQIELHTSSEREWYIIQLAVLLQHIPLPYFTAFKRFHNYIKSTTEWNLTPLEDKLRNTQYYHNVMRLYDNISEIKPYRTYRAFENFSQVKFSELGSPIQNLQLCHFGFPVHQVSLDIVGKREYIPGTTQFKETYMNKVRSLRNIGWKHLAFDQGEVKAIPLLDFIKNIQECYLPYVEEQQKIIEYAEYQRAQEVEMHKTIRTVSDFDIETINKVLSGEQIDDEDDLEENPAISGDKRKGLSAKQQVQI